MSDSEKKYLSPQTALIVVFLVLIFIVWCFPVAKLKGANTYYNGYTLMFNNDKKLDLYLFILVFHSIALFLAILGDIKVCKCFIIPLSIFNLVVSVVAIISAGRVVTFAAIMVSVFYIGVIGTALHDIAINK